MSTSQTPWIAVLLVALMVALPTAWVSDSRAQVGTSKTPAPETGGRRQGAAPGAGSMQLAQGTIKRMDASGRILTLDDGTELTIPSSVNVPKGLLKEGTFVKASFEERGGRNIVTSLEVRQH
jgi:hypothetical protein